MNICFSLQNRLYTKSTLTFIKKSVSADLHRHTLDLLQKRTQTRRIMAINVTL